MNKCLLCGLVIKEKLTIHQILFPGLIEESTLCHQCQENFQRYPRTRNRYCLGCGKEETAKLCSECEQWQDSYNWYLPHYPLFHYNQSMKDYMQQYKFQGNYCLRLAFQELIKKEIKKQDYDLLLPIPVTSHTMQTRGFNQVTGLIEGIKYTSLLHHLAYQKIAQSQKTRRGRLDNQQPFWLESPEIIKGRRVLLVDDIYTTGRTLYYAAVLCREAHCHSVKSLSLAR